MVHIEISFERKLGINILIIFINLIGSDNVPIMSIYTRKKASLRSANIIIKLSVVIFTH